MKPTTKQLAYLRKPRQSQRHDVHLPADHGAGQRGDPPPAPAAALRSAASAERERRDVAARPADAARRRHRRPTRPGARLRLERPLGAPAAGRVMTRAGSDRRACPLPHPDRAARPARTAHRRSRRRHRRSRRSRRPRLPRRAPRRVARGARRPGGRVRSPTARPPASPAARVLRRRRAARRRARPVTAMADTDPARLAQIADLYAKHSRQLQRLVARRAGASAQVVEDACSFAWMQLLTHARRRPAPAVLATCSPG